jgi:hypothetical protein
MSRLREEREGQMSRLREEREGQMSRLREEREGQPADATSAARPNTVGTPIIW